MKAKLLAIALVLGSLLAAQSVYAAAYVHRGINDLPNKIECQSKAESNEHSNVTLTVNCKEGSIIKSSGQTSDSGSGSVNTGWYIRTIFPSRCGYTYTNNSLGQFSGGPASNENISKSLVTTALACCDEPL